MTDTTTPPAADSPGAPVPETTPAVPDTVEGTPALENVIPADFKQMLTTDAIFSSYYKDKEQKPSPFAQDAMEQAFNGLAPRNTHEGMTASLLVQLYNAAGRYYFLAGQQIGSRPYNEHEIAEKLTRTYCMLSEAYIKQRGKGAVEQKITVQHVYVNNGGQAVIGDVNRPAGEGGR